jgi:hypothetical protein
VKHRALAVSLALSLVLATASRSRAADTETRVLQLQLEVERRLLDASARRLLDQLESERRAAQAVEAANAQAASSVSRAMSPATAITPDQPSVPGIVESFAGVADAERAMAGLLASSRAAQLAFEAQAMRVEALSAALGAVQDREPETPLDGTWDVVYAGGRRGTMRLTQVGTLVTGDYAMEDGAIGSLTGTFAANRLRLDRVDAVAGKDAVLEAMLLSGRLDGTWLATIFGRGVPESGKWTAQKRSDLPAPSSSSSSPSSSSAAPQPPAPSPTSPP